MARANRHFIKGQIWHLTHRCHKRQWLLKFKQDRDRWLFWLYQARQRYGLVVLNFVVTSNHIHLLVEDQGKREISKSIQLLASRTAQEFNNRKSRVGAFWQDRYHATAIESDQHLVRCLRYIDLNMVRAGAVTHPSQWTHSGYVETTLPVQRYRRLDLLRLCQLLGCSDLNTLQQLRFEWVEEAMSHGILQREAFGVIQWRWAMSLF